MKNFLTVKRILLCLPLLFLLMSACDTAETTRGSEYVLKVSEKSICLVVDGKENCFGKGLNPKLLRFSEKTPVWVDLAQKRKLGNVKFPQYTDFKGLAPGKYELIIKGDQLVLNGGKQVYQSPRGLGMLFVQGRKGPMIATYNEKNEATSPRPLQISEKGIVRNGKDYSTTSRWKAEILRQEKDRFAILQLIVIQSRGSSTMDTDTGTEIIITDDYGAIQNDCCDKRNRACCDDSGNTVASGESPAPEGTYSIPANIACGYESATRLMIVNCQTGEIHCWDLETCGISLSMEEGWLIVTPDADCEEDNVTICQP